MTGRGWLMVALLASTSGAGLAQAQGSHSTVGTDPAGPGYVVITSARPDSVPVTATTQSLSEALAEVYLTNPQLLAERAKLRATDEGVPAALAGWRPQISYTVAPGWAYGTLTNQQSVSTGLFNVPSKQSVTNAESRWTFQQTVTASQPIYRGGRTTAATAEAESQVRAERANLLGQEEQSFSNAGSAYVGVVEDQELYDLNVSNVDLLKKTLEATDKRFEVGDVTRTDVAQAQAALAQGVALAETAYATLQAALGTYVNDIGPVPTKLIDPQPLALPPITLAQAESIATVNNATVLAAMYTDAYAKDAVNAAYAALMPQVDLQVSAFYSNQPNTRGLIDRGGQVGPQISVPIYQGGAEYSAIRQAKQTEQEDRKLLDAARATVIAQVVQYWQGYVQAKSSLSSIRDEVHADEIALDGVEREALAGTETTLDVIYAEQALLSARLSLVQTLATVVGDSYSLAGSMGRLTARDLGLKVPMYDERAYYNAVRLLPFGTGDYATTQPGR